MKNKKVEVFKNFAIWVIASGVYCAGINLFIVPGALYSGGFAGISQLLVLLFKDTTLAQYNLNGIIYFIINVPVFIYGLKALGWKSIVKSVVVVAMESIGFSLIPIPATPIISDALANTIVGGFLSGLGCGILYMGFGLSGGTDIIGMALAKKHKRLSVGKIGLAVNIVVYTIAACVQNIEVAIYSLIAAFVASIIADKVHIQNRSVTVNVFTNKQNQVCEWIHKNLTRGATVMSGQGSYTHETKYMVIAVMSEYESRQFQKALKDIDKDAFVFIDTGVGVVGNYEKRLS